MRLYLLVRAMSLALLVVSLGLLAGSFVAVFDKKGQRMLSDVNSLTADEGQIAFFQSQGVTYLFFAGSVTFQGWTDWNGGLWKAGPGWVRVWPVDPGFWTDRAVEIGSDRLTVLERKVFPRSPGRTIPDYRFVPAYELLWIEEKATFETVP